MTALRLGVVNYLNALPLWEALRNEPGIELIPDVPSKLAAQLAEGTLDAGLLPAIEYFRAQDVVIAPGVCIGCFGPVKSVRLFHRVPVGKILTLASDPGSRTSNVLAQVLLADHYNIRPQLTTGNGTVDNPIPIGADAAVVIGDPALIALERSTTPSIDMGEAWREMTGLPFVFAAWLVRRGSATAALFATLKKAADKGLGRIDQSAQDYGPKLGLDAGNVADYLRSNIRFTLGERELEGLAGFGRRAARLGLAPERRVETAQGLF
ncbi:MAG: menaquinone biosynthesis protein [Planctomycetes bacterium]|nr:menaquinone biosynthesis protein [Planctomycetota bacterium]NUQ34459.1 menaquinone biosynthesis protein [Planctomycetaceae bacterium]